MDCCHEDNEPGEPGAHRLQSIYTVGIYAYMFNNK